MTLLRLLGLIAGAFIELFEFAVDHQRQEINGIRPHLLLFANVGWAFSYFHRKHLVPFLNFYRTIFYSFGTVSYSDPWPPSQPDEADLVAQLNFGLITIWGH